MHGYIILCKEEQMYWLSFANCYIVESGANPDDCDKVGIMDNIVEELQVLLLTLANQEHATSSRFWLHVKIAIVH